MPFTNPIAIEAGQSFVVSTRNPEGGYASATGIFNEGRRVDNGWLTADSGVYTYGDGFASETSSGGAAYFVDVVFEPGPPTVRAVDGGVDYYARFRHSLPTTPDYFPVSVWFADTRTQAEIDADKRVGINTYVELTTASNLDLIADAGLYSIPSWGNQNFRWPHDDR